MTTEADTCRRYVLPKLVEGGWDTDPHSFTEQRTFTDGRIVVLSGKVRRRKQKRADYLLRYTRDFPIAVVEAKAEYKTAQDGLQQAKEYAEILGLRFAYATNGHEIIEFDSGTGLERRLDAFPEPSDLWERLRSRDGMDREVAERLLTPAYHESGKIPRYYQEIAINRTVQAVLQGQRRILLTMATGTGKTMVAFQVCWKLWNARWNRSGEHRRPKILYLADRNILIDDPKDKTFAPFGDARWKIEHGKASKGREMYFAIYQALAGDESRTGLYKEYARDFFDLIIIDECHRGSARDDSTWREILDYFSLATQLGMTATPFREENRDTYDYFGNPIYQYSLRQGIEDGFLAPYRVHRVVTTWDATGWRPAAGELDRYGYEIPDDEYQTKDFERAVSLRARTETIAAHLTEFLRKSGRYAKTIVFCVDQEHASEMRHILNNLNADLVQQHADYVCRVTADEGEIGRGHLSRFQDPETLTPAILTTSQLLTTGVDAPTCTNIVLARVIGSMAEFKQIIGRGTRVRDDYGKLYFNILDYTGSATRLFADPSFDGYPENATVEVINAGGDVVYSVDDAEVGSAADSDDGDVDDWFSGDGYSGPFILGDEDRPERRKYYVDGGQVEIAAHLVYELDPDGKQLRVVTFTDYTAEKVRTLYPTAAEMRAMWADPQQRAAIIEQLADRGIDFDKLAAETDQPDADPFDLLCHIAFNAPLRTRRERADRLRREKRDFFEQYGPEAKAILNELLDKYADYGTAQFVMPDVLKVPPISAHGNVSEIIRFFGGSDRLREAVNQLQTLLYVA
ncbi:EcoAI/FtnUII family type I restriction enzme subunit R [Nitrolancea hollandica]|uniref:Type I restriction enzyme EcoEI R protein n=1 Tax=Nitrolancea hollandica Lb TaxID=1129897 RepID=I4ED42_9BACT|nr:DEAD/DEAH box helicase family protein [Nitrolancea hollandica]CCF82604.1 Type I restriction enzyme EcoEI R protein [Nitrolancea hollandica Lb]